MKLTLGLNFYTGHDSSVFVIFEDDIYAISQERLSRIKHDNLFPIDAIKEALRYKNIDPLKIKELNVGVATKRFENILVNKYQYTLSSLLRKMLQKDKKLYKKELEEKKEELKKLSKLKLLFRFLSNKYGRRYLFYLFLNKKLPLKKVVYIELKKIFKNAKIDIEFFEHHLCHNKAAFFSSGFSDALAVSLDGEGDFCFSKAYNIKNKEFFEISKSKNVFVKNMEDYDFANKGEASIGNIYSTFTYLLGFTPNADEGKVEALAAFGEYNNFLYHKLKNAYKIENLSIKLDPNILNEIYEKKHLEKIFKKLKKEDISAALQKFLEDVVLEYLKELKKYSNKKNLILSGGVAANVILNNKIYEELFENIYIHYAMGDEGVAQGAAILKYLQKNKTINIPKMPYFGSSFSNEKIKKVLKKSGLKYKMIKDPYKKAAKYILDGKIGAIFQGRIEFGPRALGNRSIIANAMDKNIQQKLNKQIKKRPLFQPFCPSALLEEKDRLFEKAYPNPHMTCAFKLKKEYKDTLPAAAHIDLTSRVQFVTKEDNPNFYKLLYHIKKLSGYGIIINTSFNKHGRTIVFDPEDAVVDFLDTNIDFMIIGDFWVQR